jgi:hypothetical protein
MAAAPTPAQRLGLDVPLVFSIALHLKSRANVRPTNTRLAAIIERREKTTQRKAAWARTVWALQAGRVSPVELVPCHVILARVSAGCLDDDNLAYAFKNVRDGIADALGVDDGSIATVSWEYRQQLGRRGQHSILVGLQRRP